MEMVVSGGETAALRERINSLGLFDDRLKSLLAITRAFLGVDAPPEKSAFGVDLKEHKIHGDARTGLELERPPVR